MRHLKEYHSFEFINESRVFYLPSFRSKIISLIDSTNDSNLLDYLSKILENEGDVIESDTTFISLSDDSDMCCFSSERDIATKFPYHWELLSNNSVSNLSELEAVSGKSFLEIENQNRQKIKIGKLLKKIVPTMPDSIVERIVNMLKSFKSGYEFKIVSGEEIVKYYTLDSCKKTSMPGKDVVEGPLGSSCMMDKVQTISHLFDIYTKNPQSCRLAVMLDSDGKLVARALLWKISKISPSYGSEELFDQERHSSDWIKKDDLYFLDRIYYIQDWQEVSFRNWAKENGFMFKYTNRLCYKNKYVEIPRMLINLKKIYYKQFPFIDTFKFYNVKNATLSNYEGDGDIRALGLSGDYFGGSTSGKVRNYLRRFKEFI